MAFHAALAIALMSANPTEAAPMQPDGPWVVAHEENICLLQRSYGAGQNRLTISFGQLPASRSIHLYLFEPAPTRSLPMGLVKIGFGPGTPAVESTLLSFFSREKSLRTFESGLKRVELQHAEASGQLTLDAGAKFSHKFAVPGLSKALAKVDECAADLLARWGLSREQLSRTAQFPEFPERWIMPEDYPYDAMESGIGGEAWASFRVNALGVASDCKILKSSGNKSLDHGTCRVLLRTKYRPALDHEGKPIDSMSASSVRWQVVTR